jgi:hypothetical protein
MQPLLGRAFAGIAKGAVTGMKRELDRLAAEGHVGVRPGDDGPAL